MKDIFWTYPAEAENGNTLIITGRDGIESLINSGKYIYRVDVSLSYSALPDGMPAPDAAADLEKITDALLAETGKDPAAVITGIYTGDGRRDWIFYTRSLYIFRNIFNRALESLPAFLFEMAATEDPGWEEYRNMKDSTYIPDEDI